MKNLYLYLGGAFVVLLVVTLLLVGLVSNSVLPVGDQFYDERCIDTSQYLSQGYTNEKLDSNGCQIVATYSPVACQKFYANGFFGNQVNTACVSRFGVGYRTATGFDDAHSNHWVSCCLYVPVEKGGFERVLNYCTYDVGDLLVAESFAGSQTITKNNLRYPIKAFCRAHPAIVTSGLTSYSSSNIPQDLIDGKSVTLPAGTVTIFYVINNIYNLPNRCDSAQNLALDLANNYSCASTIGFTYLCTDGIWDASTGSCTVMRTAECGLNERLTINSDGSKVCLYNPPLQVDCPDGYTYDKVSDSCYRVPLSVDTCPSPYKLFSPSQSECSGTWELCPQCPIDKVCSNAICQPKCSVGVECRLTPSFTCVNGTLDGDRCTIAGQVTHLCPTDSTWSDVSNACIIDSVEVVKCPDNSTPTNGKCISIPIDYKVCPANQVLNAGTCQDTVSLRPVGGVNYTIYYIIGLFLLLIGIVVYATKKKKGGKRWH